MKKILSIVSLPALLLLCAGFACNEAILNGSSVEAKAFFWTNDESTGGEKLYVDDVYSGTIPYIADELTTPGNTIIQEKGLMLLKKPGKYEIRVTDNSGNMSCKGGLLLKFGRNTEISSSWNNGKCKVEVVYNK
jgi:hypothetical protein